MSVDTVREGGGEPARGGNATLLSSCRAWVTTLRVAKWVRKWILDGWLTTGPQIATPPGITKMFCRCHECRRVWPHWYSNMTREEFRTQSRTHLGCPCGSLKLAPCYLPAYLSVWWFVVRGYLVRKVLLKKRVWDPRIPVMFRDYQ